MATKAKQADGRATALLKALAHPLRYRLMTILTEREASPTELAEVLDENFKKVCEHVQVLEDGGWIELVDTDRRLGGQQHFFRAKIRATISTEKWATLPLVAREEISAGVAQQMVVDLVGATEAGTLDSKIDRHLVRMPLILDDEGFGEADEAACELLEKLHEIAARSNERLRRSGKEGINATSATAIFELPPKTGY